MSADVVLAAEHDLADAAFLVLIRQLRRRTALVDLAGGAVPGGAQFVVVRSPAMLGRASTVPTLVGALPLAIGFEPPLYIPDPVTARRAPVAIADGPRGLEQLRAVLVPDAAVPKPLRVRLSEREREVVGAYVLGATVEQTAQRFFISGNTVRAHYRRVIERYQHAGMSVANKSQLLVRLLADGWIGPDDLGMHNGAALRTRPTP